MTLQDISDISVPAPLQFYLDYRQHKKRNAEAFFLPNKVLSIDLKTGRKRTLYDRLPISNSYPTSAAISRDGQYLLVTVWHVDGYTNLKIYSLQEFIREPNNLL